MISRALFAKMPRRKMFSVENLPPLGTWVRLAAAPQKCGGVTKAEQTEAQTAALVTSVSIECNGTCTVVYPNEFVLRGFFEGSPFKRIEDVPLSRLRSTDASQVRKLEKHLHVAISLCGMMALGQDRFPDEQRPHQDADDTAETESADDTGRVTPMDVGEKATDPTDDVGRVSLMGVLADQLVDGGVEKHDDEICTHVALPNEARDRSRSPLPNRIGGTTSPAPAMELTPQRQRQLRLVERTLLRQMSDEKSGADLAPPRALPTLDTGKGVELAASSSPSCVDKPVLLVAGAKLDRKRLLAFTCAVSRELHKHPYTRIATTELARNLSDAFSMPEVASGLQTLDKQNKILLLDSLVIMV